MNITIMFLQSLDGYIAKSSTDNLSWGSKEDKQFLWNKVNEIGTIVVGRKTYDKLPKHMLKGIETYVLSRNKQISENHILNESKIHVLNCSVTELYSYLEKQKKSAVVIGGQETISQFLKENLVDELFITVAPILFGQGIKAFTSENNQHIQLKLSSIKTISNDEILLHYITTR